MMKQGFEEYMDFVKGLDVQVGTLALEHKKNMKCGKGCSSCCLELNVFPVEFYYIKYHLLREEFDFSLLGVPAPKGECPFLVDDLCAIYPYRPYICRTHGLPMISMGDEGWELSHCELNFSEVSEGYFSMDNTLTQDKLNSELFLINQRFLNVNSELTYADHEMIAMRELISI